MNGYFAYAAGFFDGEGCVFVTKCSHYHYRNGYNLYLAIMVGNTNKAILDWLQRKFGGKIYLHKGRERRKPYWHWQLQRQKAVPFLKGILPYLKIKQDQVKLALEFQSYKKHIGRNVTQPNRQEEIFHELQRLKKL